MKHEVKHYIEYGLLYVVLFFILREWLVAIVELTDTGHLLLLTLFLALCCVLNVLEVPLLISWLLKGLYISWFVVKVYTEGALTLFSVDGVRFLLNDMSQNISVILSGQFNLVTNPFRSILFFLLIWMLVYLIDYWLKVRMTIFYFFVLTVFFIATLDTFTGYDGTFAIVKVVLLGLMVSALLYFKRLLAQTGTSLTVVKYIGYVVPIVVAIGVMGVVAILLPKAEPQWPDPVPYIKSLSEGSGSMPGQSSSKVGLGDDDTQLGGSFSPDDTVVFTIEADEKQYWRVETKDFYTTKGWESSLAGESFILVNNNQAVWSIMPGQDVEQDVAVVQAHTKPDYLVQAYGLMEIHYGQDADLYINESTERFVTRAPSSMDEKLHVDTYELTYQTPNYSYTALKEPVEEPTVQYMGGQYLQMPGQMPQRVVDLALEVTAGKTLPYDKAREIEQYFRRNGFVYETKNVPVPAEDQDYVDQFLFETKRGYCDNFSTAMVMMLRANDIPARWVKGFASGTEIEHTEGGKRVFEIQNNDAHSWVEAYIDGIGWMMFEPTVGYAAPSQIDYDLESTDDAADELLQQQEQDRTVQQEQETEAAKVKEKEERSFTWLYVLLAVAALLAIIAFVLRRKWVPKMHIANQRRKADDKEAVQSAYKVLLKQLEHIGLVRKPDETLSHFAQRVDMHLGTDDMSRITDVYEKSIYSQHGEHFSFEEIQQSWESIMNATVDK